MNPAWMIAITVAATTLLLSVISRYVDHKERRTHLPFLKGLVDRGKQLESTVCQPGQYILMLEDQDVGSIMAGRRNPDTRIVNTITEALREAKEHPDDEMVVAVLDHNKDLILYGLRGRLYFRESVE